MIIKKEKEWLIIVNIFPDSQVMISFQKSKEIDNKLN